MGEEDPPPDSKSIEELLSEHNKRCKQGFRAIEGITPMRFEGFGLDGFDIYNTSRTIIFEGKQYIFARREPRHTEISQVVLCRKENNGVWILDERFKSFDNEQDPFVTLIGDEVIYGGVRVIEDAPLYDRAVTVLRRGPDIFHLEKFARIPGKCNRLAGLDTGELGLYIRPQSPDDSPEWYIGGRGQIGFMRLPNIDALSFLTIKDYHNPGTLINGHNGMFVSLEWGGANDVALPFVFGHVARHNLKIPTSNGEVTKQYFPMAFYHDIETNTAHNLIILATRDDFPRGIPPKRPELEHVVYMGGFNRGGPDYSESYGHFSVGDTHKFDGRINPKVFELLKHPVQPGLPISHQHVS